MSDNGLKLFINGYKLTRNGAGNSKWVYYRCPKKSDQGKKCTACYKISLVDESILPVNQKHLFHAEKDEKELEDEMADYSMRRCLDDVIRSGGQRDFTKVIVENVIKGLHYSEEAKIRLRTKHIRYELYYNRKNSQVSTKKHLKAWFMKFKTNSLNYEGSNQILKINLSTLSRL